MKAKKALEAAVLRIAQADPAARKALAEAAAGETAPTEESGAFVVQGVHALRPRLAAPVRMALDQGVNRGGANCIRGVARQVTAQLEHAG